MSGAEATARRPQLGDIVLYHEETIAWDGRRDYPAIVTRVYRADDRIDLQVFGAEPPLVDGPGLCCLRTLVPHRSQPRPGYGWWDWLPGDDVRSR